MTVYRGRRAADEVAVWFDRDGRSQPLPPRLDLRNHSPTGFEWGYGGSGPAQLALAICAHHLGDDEKAMATYQDFKFAVVARLGRDQWSLSSDTVRTMLDQIVARREGRAQDSGA